MISTVTDRHAATKEWYRTLFEQNERTLNGHRSHLLQEYRRAAIDRLQQLPFPNRKNEDWKYTNVNKLLQIQFKEGRPVSLTKDEIAPFSFKDLETYQLVFLNGQFCEGLSSFRSLPEGVVVKNMETALLDPRFQDLVKGFFAHWTQVESNPFVVMNAAFAKHGIFIHVPKNVVLEKPIHLLNLTIPSEEPRLCNPQMLLVAEANSQVSLLESYHAMPGGEVPCFTNALNRIVAKENAFVRHYKLQNENKNNFLINNAVVHQHRDSTYSSYAIDLGGKLVRNNLTSVLKGQGTMTNLYGVFLANGEQHIDNQTFMDHAFPHCNSNELYKGILTDRARGVFNGKVIVRPDAQKTNAFQQNSNLVLSETAIMDSKPQLEIFADDVKCSHGATVGQLNGEAVFYLRTRGLTDEKARSLLQHAFLMEVIEKIEIQEVRDSIENLVLEKFES